MAFKYKTKKRPSPMQLAVTSFAAGAAQGVAGATEQALKRETANKTSRDKASQKWMSMAKSFVDPKAKSEAYRVGMALIYGKMTEDEAFEIMSPLMSAESSFVKPEEPKFLSDEKKLMINQIKFYSEETTDPNRKADLIDLHGKLLGDEITPDEAKEILTTSGLIAGEVTTPAGVVTEREGVAEIAVPATTVLGAFEPEAEEPEEEGKVLSDAEIKKLGLPSPPSGQVYWMSPGGTPSLKGAKEKAPPQPGQFSKPQRYVDASNSPVWIQFRDGDPYDFNTKAKIAPGQFTQLIPLKVGDIPENVKYQLDELLAIIDDELYNEERRKLVMDEYDRLLSPYVSGEKIDIQDLF